MRLFLKTLYLFTGFTLIAIGGIIIAFIGYADVTLASFPAPKLSNSNSFNEKMAFLRQSPKKADIMAIGSSISLNNLSSTVLTKAYPTQRFINTASWGMSLKDTYFLLKTLTPIYSPKTIILGSHIIDFQQENKKVAFEDVSPYIMGSNTHALVTHLSLFNLKHYITNALYIQEHKSKTTCYRHIGFDAYGTINYPKENFERVAKYWNADYLTADITPTTYAYLDSIANYCQSQKMTLLFFQSPYREGIYSTLSKDKKDKLATHLSNIKQLMNRHQQHFIDANERLWNDALFIDGIHLNKEGAAAFTQYSLSKAKKQINE